MSTLVMPGARSDEQPASSFKKRSFLKLPVKIDVEALLKDYRSIPREAWATSHWNIHCSADMLLLRGGSKGTAEDFTTRQVSNNQILDQLPYISWLLSEDGPFGLPTYAFLFRMKPMGVTRPHHDDDPAWYDPVRIHVPITTNDNAFLMSEKHVKHLDVGEVWTFDNQSFHAVVNGDSVRTHLIFDVLPNPKVNHLLEQSEFDAGVLDEERWKQSFFPEGPPVLAPATAEALTVAEKIKLGLNPDGFAARITKLNLVSRLTFAPLRAGDTVVSVNGVDECSVARTAIDYIHVRHKAGEVVTLDIIRNGKRREVKLRLFANPVPKSLRQARHTLLGLRRRYG